jgi:hypothetical protein
MILSAATQNISVIQFLLLSYIRSELDLVANLSFNPVNMIHTNVSLISIIQQRGNKI